MLIDWFVSQKKTRKIAKKRTDVVENQVKDLLQKAEQRLILMVRQ